MYSHVFNKNLILMGIGCILLFPAISYAGPPMGGLGEGLALIFFGIVIQFVLLLVWFAIHAWPMGSNQKLLITRTIIDVIVIIFSSLSLGFWFKLSFRYFWGGGLWVPLVKGYNWFYPYRLSLLLLLICFITYILNKFILLFPRIVRLFVHFFICTLVALSLLTLFEPKIAGPITRFFVNPDLFSKYDDPVFPQNDLNKPGSWRFIKWSEFYSFQSSQIKK